ncbi:hypothetical protein [Mesorhizobium huakuii]|uniref:Uncharacterized protein n=1 Tax=Mesorhizobium huakuii TaxID=28104 RepID=A0ABZ0VLZ9_9HYPH|nr:hypothetical protein [Mesorhizobium huakuii]WQB98288.1 hypothetical protein U0R22_002433 [Mesorhizobium huakuii]
MPTLPLALKIADAVSNAQRRRRRLDIAAVASLLLDAHPEAGHSLTEIADTLREEVAFQGPLAKGIAATSR